MRHEQGMFVAKSIAPLVTQGALRYPVLEQAADAPVSLFTVPAGYIPSESLMAALADRGKSTLWLRLGPEDSDPATFLISLIASAQRIAPGVGLKTLERMRREPGPLFGWSMLFDCLSAEMAANLPPSSAIVLDNLHYLNSVQPVLGIFSTHFLASFRPGMTSILISKEQLPPAALPPDLVHRGPRDLRLDSHGGLAWARKIAVELPDNCINRIIDLIEGRAVALTGIFTAINSLGSTFIQQAVKRSRDGNELLTRITRASLAPQDADSLRTLALTMHLEYSHPLLIQSIFKIQSPPDGPWFQSMEEGWRYIHQIWRAPLNATLRSKINLEPEVLERLSQYLISQGATGRAIQLYIESGNYEGAAQILAGEADSLMSLGQWETLNYWLSQIPPFALQAWPWLIYTKGELASAQGYTQNADQALAEAANLFVARKDSIGACQSLLAESTLAGWHNDQYHARACALAASAIAESAGLTWQKGWAAWQLGCLAIVSGKTNEALKYFHEATTVMKDPQTMQLFQQFELLVLHQQDLQQQAEFHHQAYLTLEQSQQATLSQLHSLIESTPGNLPNLLGSHNWSNIPLSAKLPTPLTPAETLNTQEKANFMQKILMMMGHRKNLSPITGEPGTISIPAFDLPLSIPISSINPITEAPPASSIETVSATDARSNGDSAGKNLLNDINLPIRDNPLQANRIRANSTIALNGEKPNPPEPEGKISQASVLTAHLLGFFRLSIDDRPIEKLPGSRGVSVLKYLLFHHRQETPRDVLMDMFWPEASPQAARNNLNVALHNLRQAFRPVTELPIVIYDNNLYQLNPDLKLWLDIDEFERHHQAARQLEANGQLALALSEYEIASSLYQGDFLADDPYEDWPVTTRERLRMMHMETLDHLSRIYFSQRQYTACADLCQRLLERDNCREDAHCLLMRCYSRQNQHNLALRQYQVCVEALRKDLDVDPEPATTQLAERIRRREQV